MTSPTIVVLGERLRALEPIPTVGAVFGLGRNEAYSAAEAQEWPTVRTSKERRKVIVPRLLNELGIPYTVEASEHLEADHAGD